MPVLEPDDNVKTIEELLRSLARPEVLEFGLVTDRLPSVNVGGKYEPVDETAPSSERVLAMLTSAGGGQHIGALSDKPAHWTTRIPGIGVVSVAAIRRDDVIQARFKLAERETKSGPPPGPAVRKSAPPAAPRTSASPVPRPVASVAPPRPPPIARTGPVRPVSLAPKAAKPAPSAKPVGAPDEDEPTLQTVLSPKPPPPRPPTAAPPSGLPMRMRSPSSAEVSRVLPPREPESDIDAAAGVGPDDGHSHPSAPPVVRRSPSSATVVTASPEHTSTILDPTMPLDAFLAMAVSEKASDLHVIGGRPVSLRIGMDLVPRTDAMTSAHAERLTKAIVPTRLREAFERDGHCHFAYDHPTHGRFRVNASRHRTGDKLTFRLVPTVLPQIASLGLPGSLVNVTRLVRGLVLVTGLRGHGKTSTLAALVERMNRDSARHIMTIEEPIEHVYPPMKALVSQREIGIHSKSWSRAFETALEDDVDTLVIGEIRDAATARQALLAASGGRLVLATFIASSAAGASERFVDLFPPADEVWARATLSSALAVTIHQRLVPSDDGATVSPVVDVLAADEKALVAGKGG